MNLFVLYAAVPEYDHGVRATLQIVTDALTELGETVSLMTVSEARLPYYDGQMPPMLQPLWRAIAASDGVILAAASSGNAPCALAKNFFEYMEHAAHPLLAGKNCLLLTAAPNGGERETLALLSDFANRLGGHEAVRICGCAEETLAANENIRLTIGRQAEDYYRILRQNRQYVLPRDLNCTDNSDSAADSSSPQTDAATAVEAQGTQNNAPAGDLSDSAYAASLGISTLTAATAAETAQPLTASPSTTAADLYAKHKQRAAAAAPEAELDEISQLFAKKFLTAEGDSQPTAPVSQIAEPDAAPQPSGVTCKQMTQNLPDAFNTHAAADLQATLQINVTGDDAFTGHLIIQDSECIYVDEQAEQPDITITADAKAWTDVLSGKHTAQRALTLGYVKARGNFPLLAKFDQIFKK